MAIARQRLRHGRALQPVTVQLCDSKRVFWQPICGRMPLTYDPMQTGGHSGQSLAMESYLALAQCTAVRPVKPSVRHLIPAGTCHLLSSHFRP